MNLMIYQRKIVWQMLVILEIEVCDEPDIYVIDVDSQKKVKAKLQLTSELDDWTKDDECYCMIFKRKLDNQTMSDVAFDNILKSGVPTQVKVIYGKQGLIYLDTSCQYDFITCVRTEYYSGRITIYTSGNRWRWHRLQYQI